MATSTKPVTGAVAGPSRTAIVAARDPNTPAGQISPAARAMLQERKERNLMAQKIRGTQWGINDHSTALAIANYCYANKIDPIRHVEVLGGRVYLTATFYQEAGAALIAEGKVSKIEVDHISVDPRLDEQYLEGVKFAAEAKASGQESEAQFWTDTANRARREMARRRMLRIQHNANEKAAAIVVVRVWPNELSEPIEGCNWCGNGVRGKYENGKPKDPVGDLEPTKTAETRAARRAWKQLCTVLPTAAPAVLLAEEEGAALTEVLEEARRLAPGDEPEEQITQGVVQSDDPYAMTPQPTAAPAPAIEDDLEFDRALMADETRDASPPGSKSVRMPKGGNVQDALGLNDQPRRSTDALRNG